MSSRSFFWGQRQFPVCARCTGQIIGAIISAGTYWLWCMDKVVLVLFLLPLIIDGSVQKIVKSYESNNIRRLWTGILFGYAIMCLFLWSVVLAFSFGFELGLKLK